MSFTVCTRFPPALTCPANSVYAPRASGCPNTCASPESENRCAEPTMEGCRCAGDRLLDGHDCVLPSECGCTYQGRYFSVSFVIHVELLRVLLAAYRTSCAFTALIHTHVLIMRPCRITFRLVSAG